MILTCVCTLPFGEIDSFERQPREAREARGARGARAFAHIIIGIEYLHRIGRL